MRAELCDEAIWLARVLATLMPASPRSSACSRSCCCSTPATRPASTPAGALVLLEEQDRSALGPRA